MLLSHTRSTRTDLFAHWKLLTQLFTQKVESKKPPKWWSMRRDLRTSQSYTDSVISSESTEPTWECTRTKDNSTSTSTTNHHGLSTPLINLPHSEHHHPLKDHTPSLERKPPKRDKTKLSSKLCSNGPMVSLHKLILVIKASLNWKKFPLSLVTLMSLQKFSKCSNLMNTPMSSRLEMPLVKFSTPWLSNRNSHISDQELLYELDQPHTMRLLSTKKFLCSNTTLTSWPSWAPPNLLVPCLR